MNNRISIAAIQPPEFINLQPMDVSPLMSKSDLKVFYLGQNRNGSAITKATATNMAKTLRGCPIVGQYIDKKEDFGDHGDQLIIDGEGMRFNVLTKPFGFVSPDAKVWFQFFEDKDEFGNTCMREYLMTECYLWTSQFPEVDRVIKEHNPHSMELDENTIKGHWATDNNRGIDFFIIDDAQFSKLCILGEDVEPCFEGSMFLEPTMSSSFSKGSEFAKSLATMMEELKFALNKKNEGGASMDAGLTNEEVQVTEFAQDPTVQASENQASENFSNSQDNSEQTNTENIDTNTEEFAKNEKKEEKPNDNEGSEDAKNPEEGGESKSEDDEDEEKKKAAKNALVAEELENTKAELAELQNKYVSLEEQYNQLVAFKAAVEDKEKEDLIASFYMLSDEDKADVIANKAQYSLDEIESKLSVICVRKKVSFANEKEEENSDTVVTAFNLNSHQADNLPAWLKAVEAYKQTQNN